MKTRTMSVIRIKLGDERPSTRASDSRPLVGYSEGLSEAEVWERGRAAWKMKAENAIGAEIALIAYGGVVRAVGTVDGISKQEDRLVIEGTVISGHPLVGQADPLHNRSQNPVAYGDIDAP